MEAKKIDVLRLQSILMITKSSRGKVVHVWWALGAVYRRSTLYSSCTAFQLYYASLQKYSGYLYKSESSLLRGCFASTQTEKTSCERARGAQTKPQKLNDYNFKQLSTQSPTHFLGHCKVREDGRLCSFRRPYVAIETLCGWAWRSEMFEFHRK